MADNLGLNSLVGFCRKMSRSNTCRKLRKCAKKSFGSNCNDTVEAYFLHEVQFSAAIEAAYFPAAFGMLLSQHPKEGATFMGTALAAHKQSH